MAAGVVEPSGPSDGKNTLTAPPPRDRRTIAGLLDPRANALNFVRLVLASSVIFWHAFPLSGRAFPFEPAAQISGSIAVDGFFAISGFLLAGSWLHKPHLLTYAKNRFLRIVPAFWVCLLVVAFIFAPLAALAQDGSTGSVFQGPHAGPLYVLQNAGLSMRFYDVAGSPLGVAREGVWNGSLWTLRWEAFAYVGLALLGLLGLLRRRAVVLVVLVLLWLASVAIAVGVLPAGYWQSTGSRLGLMFVCGMVLSLYGERIPASRRWAAAAGALLVLSPFLPDYRILGAPALAYLVVWFGGALTHERLRLADRDISYGLYIYAFPVQQGLVLAGAASWPVLVYSLAALVLTVPLAIASWLLVERPALRLKTRRARSGRRVGAQPAHPEPLAVAEGPLLGGERASAG